MRSTILLLCSTTALAGCAATARNAQGPITSGEAAPPSAVQSLQRETEDQARRIVELEARLALLEQEARAWRREAPVKPTETVRIGARSAPEPDEPVARRGVAVVHLHEREPEPQPEAAFEEPLVLPAPPPGVATKLAVVPLPHERASRALAGDPPLPADDDRARAAYRAALRLLRDRRWDDALSAFSEFLRAYPEHELAANATYWRGEARYAQRRYADALTDFTIVISRFARSDKVADALFKLGMCQRRLGDEAAAEQSFRKLREQYPTSEAARIASRENAS